MIYQIEIVHQYIFNVLILLINREHWRREGVVVGCGGHVAGFPCPASHSCCAVPSSAELDFLFNVQISDLPTVIKLLPRSQTD